MMRSSAVEECINGLVHPSAGGREFAVQRGMILSHLLAGVAGYAILPLALLLRGAEPTAVEIVLLCWLIAPIAVALGLSRTGDLGAAVRQSITATAALVLGLALCTGGILSPLMIAIPPLAFAAFGQAGIQRSVVAAWAVGAPALLLAADLLPGLARTDASGINGVLAFTLVCLLVAVAHLLTEKRRRLAEQRALHLGEAEAQMAFITSNMSDAVLRHLPDGRILWGSTEAAGLLGVAPEALAGSRMLDHVHIGDRPAFLTALAELREGGAAEHSFRLKRRRGERAPPDFANVDMRAMCLQRESGQREMLTVLRTRSDVAEIANEDGLKGRLLANVSHELRTPLNAIIGFSELMTRQGIAGLDQARRVEYAGLIHESGLHLLAVVNGMLDVSRLETGNFAIEREPFSLRPVISSCLQLFELKVAAAAISLHTDIASDLPQVFADKRACKQILINLISNAIKFTPPGGEVRVSAKAVAGVLQIEVSDTGVGISSEDLPQLGTCFFQAGSNYSRMYEGTGVGLSVVKGLIALHGGRFDVRSRLGNGTNVVVELPLVVASMVGQDSSVPVPRAANG
jgi:cell cycle sensor histidine kinase DivJ